MISYIKIKNYLLFILFFILSNNYSTARENKLFWDGLDWNRITKSVDYNNEQTFKIKKAYLNGVLDGRLNYYLKTWSNNKELADEVFNETVDYLTIRELIKKECDEIMQISIKNNLKFEIDSLNVSNATSIALYQFYST